MLTFLLTAFLFAAAPQALAAPSIVGTWALSGSVSGVDYTAKCTFTQTGNALGGNCSDTQGVHELKGKIDGTTVTFSLDSTYNGDAITSNYSGKLTPDGKLAGSVEVEPYGVDGTFTATQPAAPPAK